MTLRFIVARILRELIELAECGEDAELVDALHDALDVASPARTSRWFYAVWWFRRAGSVWFVSDDEDDVAIWRRHQPCVGGFR